MSSPGGTIAKGTPALRMDELGWLTLGSGLLFGVVVVLRMAIFLYSESGDASPAWRLATWATGLVAAGLAAADAAFPVTTAVYAVNAGTEPVSVWAGDETFCLPGRTYRGVRWRDAAPAFITARSDAGAERRYAIGKGTWFVNVSGEKFTADVVDRSNESVIFDALTAGREQSIHLNVAGGEPFRLYSAYSLDQATTLAGDIVEDGTAGQCSGKGTKPALRRS